MVDKNLFVYLTHKSGHSLGDAARVMALPLSGLSRRLNGRIDFRRSEMEAWMQMVGTTNAGPVFFPDAVAPSQQDGGDT